MKARAPGLFRATRGAAAGLFYRLVQHTLEADPVYCADVASGLKTSEKSDGV